MSSRFNPTRRRFVAGLAMAAMIPAVEAGAAPGPAGVGARAVGFLNLHTGERERLTYWADGRYLPEALKRINVVLRDHRNNAVAPMDPKLIDLLHMLARTLDSTGEFEVISGYRSPASNRMLADRSGGVATNSLHTRGMAIDIRVPGRRLTAVRDAARTLAAGGVGFYPKSDFVHVDVGRVRFW